MSKKEKFLKLGEEMRREDGKKPESVGVTWFGVSYAFLIRWGCAALLCLVGLFLPFGATLKLVLSLISFLVSGYDILLYALRRLYSEHVFGEELLISLSCVVAFAISAAYEAAAVMLLYQAGRILRDYTRELSRNNMRDRVDPYPGAVRVLGEDENFVNVDVQQIRSGSVIQLAPGERVPVDCTITEGNSSVDFSGILGHEQIYACSAGSKLFVGCTVLDGTLMVTADCAFSESLYEKALDVVSDPEAPCSSGEHLAHRIARVYAPFALGLSLLTALVLLIFSDGESSVSIHRALVLLVIASPSALVLPGALSGLGGLYRSVVHGVVVRGTAVFEALGKAGAAVFDKDDILTTGKYRVLSIKSERTDPNVLLQLAAHVLASSELPYASSVIAAYGGIIDSSLVADRQFASDGVSANIHGIRVLVGSKGFMQRNGIQTEEFGAEFVTLYLTLNGTYAGCILLADSMREEAAATIYSLEASGCKCILLSSDNEENTAAAAAVAGVREYRANCLPMDRIACLQELKERYPVNSVLYLGKGIGDEAPLSAADVGICIDGLHSEEARQLGSVVLMDCVPDELSDTIDTARHVRKVTNQAMIGIGCVKLVILLLALLGITYQMWFAMLVDIVSGVGGALYATRSFDRESKPRK